MSLVVCSGSRQYVVDYGQQIIVNHLKEVSEGDVVDLEILHVFGDDKPTKAVKAKVLRQQKGEKLRVVKYKRKSNYIRHYGPRQLETVLEIMKPGK